MRRNSSPHVDPSDPADGVGNESFERAADCKRRHVQREHDDPATARHEPGMGDGEHADARGESGPTHQPTVGLDDPRVSAVPETTIRPGESEAQAAARLRRSGQDAWGSPEDQPDHDRNEVYVQQDEAHP